MEVFGGGGGGYPDDPYGGGWGDVTAVGGQAIGGDFEGTGEVSEGLADIMAASMAVGKGLSPAVPTKTFNTYNVQPKDARTNLANIVQIASRFTPTNMVMSLLANVVGNVPNEMMPEKDLNQGLLDQFSPIGSSLATRMGHPHTGAAMLGAPAFANENMMSVPMSGFGARMGIATARDPRTGLNMGPGRPGEPGDVNPFSGVPYADPSDPYIRRRRGAEIAGMI